MTVLAFADLDDTLFQTLRKLPLHEQVNLTPATLSREGQPHSFQTVAQQTLLALLQGSAVVIPVTGRDREAMGRVTLPFASWRVCDHGLTILDASGQPEISWARQVAEKLAPLQDKLTSLTDALRPQAEALGCRLTVHQAHGMPFMAVLKHPDLNMQVLEEIQLLWEGHLWPADGEEKHPLQVIANANNVSLLPRSLGKREAVRYLKETYFPDVTLTLGLGDSISDLGFMSECDFALTPQRGQLLRAILQTELVQR